jgi:inhibitor of KinA sporulation pathway (predicted exonuclease)
MSVNGFLKVVIVLTRKLDQIIVIDVEATCWEGSPPLGEESDIIEIGVCPVEVATGKRLEKRHIIVKPERSKVSEFCTKLTGLTPEQVQEGVSFKEACLILQEEYLTKKRTWASYGDYDRWQFEKHCSAFNVEYPFAPRHINVKNLFAIIKKLNNEVGMASALQILNLPLEGRHHDAEDDAWNVANILSKIIL